MKTKINIKTAVINNVCNTIIMLSVMGAGLMAYGMIYDNPARLLPDPNVPRYLCDFNYDGLIDFNDWEIFREAGGIIGDVDFETFKLHFKTMTDLTFDELLVGYKALGAEVEKLRQDLGDCKQVTIETLERINHMMKVMNDSFAPLDPNEMQMRIKDIR